MFFSIEKKQVLCKVPAYFLANSKIKNINIKDKKQYRSLKIRQQDKRKINTEINTDIKEI